MKGDFPKAPKIYLDDCQIDFSQPVHKVYDFIRGLDPYPAAWTNIDGMIVKCYNARIVDEKGSHSAGVIEPSDEELIVNCKPGRIGIKKVKAEGKRKMDTKDWLNGYSIQKNKIQMT
jgi:methionyl-tRNA formyltransferase